MTSDHQPKLIDYSGIFFNVREVPGRPIYFAAPEVQVLDNVDATDNKVASHLAGSRLRDLVQEHQIAGTVITRGLRHATVVAPIRT